MKPSERAETEILDDLGVFPDRKGEADIYERIEDVVRARQRVHIEESRFADDIFSMFNGAVGQRVLEQLKRRHVEVELFHNDPYVMAARVAEHDFVVRLMNIAEAANRNRLATTEKPNGL